MKYSIEHIFDYAKELANQRHNQKKNYKSCLPLSPNYELVGILGEMLFSLIIQEKMDTELRAEGDDGFDFKQVNIKTSEEHKAKHLIEFTDKSFHGYYIFIVINLKKKIGYVKGYIHSTAFKEIAEVRDFGYGKRLAIDLDQLKEYNPKSPIVLNNIYQ